MNRASLSYGLTACIPHADLTVGIERGYVYATDRYTAGIARVAETSVYAALPLGEAKDLAKFVKPLRKAHDVEDVQMLADGDELHVGIADDSAVFDLASEFEHIGLNVLLELLGKIDGLPTDHREMIYRPSYAVRFAKAQQNSTDVLRLYPRLSTLPQERGIALVSVGDAFIGAIAGLAHDAPVDALALFLQNALNLAEAS